MIVYDDIINREIVLFLKSCTDNKLPVYNSSLLSKPPKEKERIEFKLCNFVSTGQIYKTKDTTGVSYDVRSIAEYRCQLIIRIFDDALTCAKITGQLAGAIQTFDYLEQYLDRLYVKNETMRISPFIVQKDNLITNFQEIIVDCYVGIEYKNKVDFFNRLEDSVYEIN